MLHPKVRSRHLPYSTYKLRIVQLLKCVVQGLKLASVKNRLTILWTILPILLFGPPLKLFGRSVIYQITGLGSVFSVSASASRRRWLTEFVYSFLFRGENFRILVHNHEDKAFLCERFSIEEYKIHVTGGCGVDPKEFPYQSEYQGNPIPVIYAPTRLSVEKGVFDVCQASGLLDKRGFKHELWFTSEIDPNDFSSLSQEQVDQLKIDYPSVRFLGYQKSVVETLKRCDMVCIATWYREGLPTAILEAASSGRPIVTTDNVGGREFIEDGVNGKLVDPRRPDQLADSIMNLAENSDQAEQMREAAYERFLGGYTKDHMVSIAIQACAEIWPYLPDTKRAPVSATQATSQAVR